MNNSVRINIREKAKQGIDHANDTTVKMILAMLEAQQAAVVEEANEFEKEMQQRFDEYEQGKIVPITLAALEEGARKAHKKRLKSA